jgi:hypothetical protein
VGGPKLIHELFHTNPAKVDKVPAVVAEQTSFRDQTTFKHHPATENGVNMARPSEALQRLFIGEAIIVQVLAGPKLVVTRVREGDGLWLWEPPCEPSWTGVSARGFVFGEGDVEAMHASFVTRFYRGQRRLPTS